MRSFFMGLLFWSKNELQIKAFSSIYALNIGTQKKRWSKNRVNRGYLVVLKGRKIGYDYKQWSIENCGNQNHGNRGMPVFNVIPNLPPCRGL